MKVQCVDPFNFLVGPAYENDTGIDLKAASEPLIMGHRLRDNQWKHIDYIEYDTAVKLQVMSDRNRRLVEDPFAEPVSTFLFPRSSISRYNLVLCNSVGIIDAGYRDTIKVRFKYVPQPPDYIIFEKWLILQPSMDRIYQRGDKIAQLVFSPRLVPTIERVEKLPDSERGTGGFGSSGS